MYTCAIFMQRCLHSSLNNYSYLAAQTTPSSNVGAIAGGVIVAVLIVSIIIIVITILLILYVKR